jgi:hypothetical protein
MGLLVGFSIFRKIVVISVLVITVGILIALVGGTIYYYDTILDKVDNYLDDKISGDMLSSMF